MATYDITTKGASLAFDSRMYGRGGGAFLIDEGHYVQFFGGVNGAYSDSGNAQVFSINTSTWAITTASAKFLFDSSGFVNADCITVGKIDTNHFVVFWKGSAGDGYVQTFAVNTTTWAVTTVSSLMEYDTADGQAPHCVQIDDNHWLNAWQALNAVYVQVFTVNTTTYSVTTAAAKFQLETTNACPVYGVFKIDTTHFIISNLSVGNDGFATILVVNTSTWAVTTTGTRLEWDTQDIQDAQFCRMDDTHYISLWRDDTKGGAYAQVLEVNTTTWAITTSAAWTKIHNSYINTPFITPVDENNFLVLLAHYSGAYHGQTYILSVNTSTYAITTGHSNPIDDALQWPMAFQYLDTGDFIAIWAGTGDDTNDGIAQMVNVELIPPVVAPTVTTQAVDDIEKTTAQGNGNITDTGGEDNDERGFVWGTSSQSDPGDTAPGSSAYDDYVSSSGTYSTGAFTGVIDSLIKGTQYYVRAFSHNSEGYSYGDEVSFISKTDASVTKSLQYAVQYTPSALTKSLQYAVKGSVSAIEKALKYTVEITQTAIEKGLEYAVTITPSAITKGLQYAIDKATAITKSLQYIVVSPVAITKSLKYTVTKTIGAIEKSMTYDVVITPSALEKSLSYEVISPNQITKDLGYEVVTQGQIQKSLEYQVMSPTALTKSLKYTVETTPSAIQKQLQYIVAEIVLIQKSLQYEVTAQIAINKSLKYTVNIAQTAIEKSLAYEVTIQNAITKSLEYMVVIPEAITKSLQYKVSAPVVIQKGLQYYLPSTNVLTKSLRYTLTTSQAGLTKSMKYVVRIYPYSKKTSPYTRLININN